MDIAELFYSKDLTLPENMYHLWKVACWFRANGTHAEYVELNNFLGGNGYSIYLTDNFQSKLAHKLEKLVEARIGEAEWRWAYGRKIPDNRV